MSRFTFDQFLDKPLTSRQYVFLISEGFTPEEVKQIKHKKYNDLMKSLKADKRKVYDQPPTEKQKARCEELDFDMTSFDSLNRWQVRKSIKNAMLETQEDSLFIEKNKVVSKDNKNGKTFISN